MSKYHEDLCDKLIQQIAATALSQWSGLPAQVGHHMVRRGNLLWRWRVMNIMPLTFEEHQMLHAGLLDPRQDWQIALEFSGKNQLLYHHLAKTFMTRDEFVTQTLDYLRRVKTHIDKGLTTFEDVVAEERSKYGA